MTRSSGEYYAPRCGDGHFIRRLRRVAMTYWWRIVSLAKLLYHLGHETIAIMPFERGPTTITNDADR